MAGGFGTRLRPLTSHIPKPMVPVMNKPMIEHIVRLLVDHGIKEIVVLLFFHPEVIINFLRDGSQFGASVKYVKADGDYGTAGSVRNAYELVRDKRILVISGDVLTDFNLTNVLGFHESKGAKATLVLTRVTDPLQFGVVITDREGRITRFLEKPTWGEVFSDTVNTGIYVLEPDVVELVPYKSDYDFSKNLFPLMLNRNMPLYGFEAKGYWRDIGNLSEYIDVHADCLKGLVRVPVDGTIHNFQNGKLIVGNGVKLPDNLVVRGISLVGNGVTVGEGVELSNSVIGDHTSIDRNSKIISSIIWDNVQIGSGVKIVGDVIASKTIVGDNAEIEDNVFIGEECLVGHAAHILHNVKLWPKKIVDAGATLSRSLVWEDKWLSSIFTDARVTGTSNIEMVPEFASKLGAAFGALIGTGKYVVSSRDSDTVSRMINRSLIVGFMSAGVNVYDLRAQPIPIVRHELRSGRAAGGIHVRKSPFDPDLTDIIFFDGDGRDLPQFKTKAIERLFFGEEFARAPYNHVGDIFFPERTNESYREDFLKNLNLEKIRQRKFKIVLDYSYGVASTLFPTVIGSLNAQVISLNAYLDPKKLTRNREEYDNAIRQLQEVVKSLKYDFGFMFDGGGEKVVVVDETGEYINEDRLLSLVTKLFLLANPEAKKIAVPFSASREIDLIAREHAVEVIRTKATHQALMDAAYDPSIDFVGGTKGGFIFPKFLFATDAMFSVAKILEMTAIVGKSLHELDREIPKLHMVKKNLDCPWSQKGRIMRHLVDSVHGLKYETLDGIKIIYDDDSWVHLLPDKERPIFHINAESKSESFARQIVDDFHNKIISWLDDWRNRRQHET